MDLSKASDCMPHDLLIAKLNAHGFGAQSLGLNADYFSNRKQRVKIGTTYSGSLKQRTGVPQGSVLGPLFFNILLMITFTLLSSQRYAILQITTLFFSWQSL